MSADVVVPGVRASAGGTHSALLFIEKLKFFAADDLVRRVLQRAQFAPEPVSTAPPHNALLFGLLL
jgi:hypothetical protein